MNHLYTIILRCYTAWSSHTIAIPVLLFSAVVASGCSKESSGSSAEVPSAEAAPEQLAERGAHQTTNENIEPAKETPKPESSNAPKVNATQPINVYSTIEWTDLLPDEDLNALENPPAYLSEITDGSEDDQLDSQFKTNSDTALDDPYQRALVSKNIRSEFNGRAIRIPGFIVPLEFDDHETITTFFFVPFFGACIHMPPPPPNQIIYAQYEPGIRLEALYDPFWISGTLSTTLIENDLASAAYSMSVSIIEPYTE